MAKERDLVVVESPAKAKTISKILDNRYEVLSSMGHVRDLPQKKLGIDVDNGFNPTYETYVRRKSVISDLYKAAKTANAVYLATDPDREGEAIAWHLYEMLKTQNPGMTFHRVSFHEITRKAVQQAFQDPRVINMSLVNAQQARRILDRIVGYKVSPLLWRQVGNQAKSAGRVQSVALRLICEREREINGFKPQEYWNFKAHFAPPDSPDIFMAKLVRIDGNKVDVNNEREALAIAADVEGGKYVAADLSQTKKMRYPGPPFITSTLQQAASTNLGFSVKQTMAVAQQLYEGIDIGGGPTGLITYMRTDSVSIAQDAREKARDFIARTHGADYVPHKAPVYKSKKSAQEAHEAIRPTDIDLTPEKAGRFLDDKQLKLYRLIWRRFIACQMAPAQLLQHTLELQNQSGTTTRDFLFRTVVTETVFPGFLKIYNLKDVETDEGDDEFNRLPNVKVGDPCELQSLDKEQKFTEPPPRFSEGALIRELENNGVGRPSTYAAIISTIIDRKYILKKSGKLIPTPLGDVVCCYLVTNIPKLFEVKFTAEMENQLDEIEQDRQDWQKMIASFYGDFSEWITNVRPVTTAAPEVIQAILNLFGDDFPWDELQSENDQNQFDDRKFVTSLQEQVAGGKPLTGKQWNALLFIVVRTEKYLPELPELCEKLALGSVIEEQREKLKSWHEKQVTNNSDYPPEYQGQLLAPLSHFTGWEQAVKKGNRVYDDKKFYLSLANQTKKGKSLSSAQINALQRLILKYCNQLENGDGLVKELGIVSTQETVSPESRKEITDLLVMVSEITQWAEPQGKGKFKFDEKKFVESLKSQFERKNSLSPKQLNSLKRIIAKHKDEFTDFDTRAAALGF